MARSNTILNYYNALELVNCCICHTCCRIRHCFYPEYWGRYIPEQTVHTQFKEQSDNGLYCLRFDLHSDMYMYALMKHADHLFRQLCQYFWCSNIYDLKDETENQV